MTRDEQIHVLRHEIHLLATEDSMHYCTICGRVKRFTNDTWRVAKNAVCDECTPPTHIACPTCDLVMPVGDVNPFRGCTFCMKLDKEN